jgi:hypothetical protein
VYPFDGGNFAQLNATLLPAIFNHNAVNNRNLRRFPEGGTYLLPQAFAEGSPIHPSYGSGHSTVAGALGTILKAFFPGEHVILNPVVPTDDGTALTAWDPDGDPAVAAGRMREAAGEVTAVDVDHADRESLAAALAPVVAGAGLVTALVGEGAGVAPAEVEAWLRALVPDGVEVEAHFGGQAAPALAVGVE